MNRGTYEARAHAAAIAATFIPRPKVSAPARPIASYGLPLVSCPMGPAQVLLSACKRRFTKANKKPGRSETATGSWDSGLRASQCNGCTLGAERTGKPARPRVASKCAASVTDKRCKCGVLYDGEAKQCPTCTERQHNPSGNVAQRRAWGPGHDKGTL